jgi:hypothetical protein
MEESPESQPVSLGIFNSGYVNEYLGCPIESDYREMWIANLVSWIQGSESPYFICLFWLAP